MRSMSFDAKEIHEYALRNIMMMCKAPVGVMYPDGFVAGVGQWASSERKIPRLVRFDDLPDDTWMTYIGVAEGYWREAGDLILMDYRNVIPDKHGEYDRSSVERVHPGLYESSGAAFCFREAAKYASAYVEEEDEPGLTPEQSARSSGKKYEKWMVEDIKKRPSLRSLPAEVSGKDGTRRPWFNGQGRIMVLVGF